MYFDATRRLNLLRPVRLEVDPEAPDQKGGLSKNIPTLPTSSAKSRPPYLSKNVLLEKMHGAPRKKEKQFIFDEVCLLKFHYGKLMMLGTIGSRDVILRI
jgi:hypothetical protein